MIFQVGLAPLAMLGEHVRESACLQRAVANGLDCRADALRGRAEFDGLRVNLVFQASSPKPRPDATCARRRSAARRETLLGL